MNNFWENILRYPRFFVSSVAGLLLVILTPFRNLFKIPRLRFFLLLLILLIFFAIYFIIVNMTAL